MSTVNKNNKTNKKVTKGSRKAAEKMVKKRRGKPCLKPKKNISKTCDDEKSVNNHLKKLTGSSLPESGKLLLNQVISSMPEGLLDPVEAIDVAIGMFLEVEPKDQIEGMLVAQMIAVHLNSMKMAYYSSVKNQNIMNVNSSVNNMSKLMRTFILQLEALQKYRGKCNQTIQVQHVQVNDGGQAVVGNIQGGGG